MSDNDHARASIDATLTEICQGHAATGLPVEPDEFLEAWEIIDRIEARLAEQKRAAWAARWAKV